MIAHHFDPIAALADYDPSDAVLPRITHAIDKWSYERIASEAMPRYLHRDRWVQDSARLRQPIADANELPQRDIDPDQFADLVAFIGALTDPRGVDLKHLMPDRVPSGLMIDK